MEKTFREVIADIKEGEVWESHCKRIIGVSDNQIRIETMQKLNFGSALVLNNVNLYKLQRKKYTYQEAFEAYKQGKEIESLETEYRYKKIDGVDKFIYADSWIGGGQVSFQEIMGEWFIND